MTLKDTARSVAIFSALHDRIGKQLKAAKKDLEAGLKTAKAETGTQKISISLSEGHDIGTASLVQPKAAAAITDAEAFTAWVLKNFSGEITRRFVTEVRPGFQKKILDELTAAGTAEWADRETGVVHEVPGVTIQGRAAYTRLTVPDAGQEAIAEAWRTGALGHLNLPQITAEGSTPTPANDELNARLARLEKRDALLTAMEAAGVDNWQGMDLVPELLAQNEVTS